MNYKKLGILLLVLVLCGGSIFFIRFTKDTKAPDISVRSNEMTIGCKTSYSDLMDYASVKDDDVEEFFIEEKDLVEIITNKKVTYVAIDKSSNVAKETVYINPDKDVANYYIDIIKEPVFEYKQDFLITDYFRVKNGCGLEFEGNLKIDGLDINKTGKYEITISDVKNSAIEPLILEVEVIDSGSPKIKLKYKEVILEYKEEFDFKRVIDTFEDDKDSYDDLLKSLKIDNKVDNTKAGKYEVIFTVTDSEGKSGSITLPVTVKEEVKVENHEEYHEPVYNEPDNNPPQDNNPEPTPPPVINPPEPSESPIPSESPAPPESENPEGDNQPNESPDVPPVDNGSSGNEIE